MFCTKGKSFGHLSSKSKSFRHNLKFLLFCEVFFGFKEKIFSGVEIKKVKHTAPRISERTWIAVHSFHFLVNYCYWVEHDKLHPVVK